MRSTALVLAVLLCGCSDPPDPTLPAEPDAGVAPDTGPDVERDCPGAQADGVCSPLPRQVPSENDCGGPVDPSGVCAPHPPADIVWPCPDGWDALTPHDSDDPVAAYGVEMTMCRPPPPASRCPRGLAPVLGTEECAPLGEACPGEDNWPDEDELRRRGGGRAGRILYVAPGGAGDGARQTPHGDPTIALAAAVPGDIVALGAGTYTGFFEVPEGVALLGSCARDVELVGVEGADAVVRAAATSVLIGELTATGPAPGFVVRGGDAMLRGLHADRSRRVGFLIGEGATVVGSDLRANPVLDETFDEGCGLDVSNGAVATLRRVSVEDAHGIGVFLYREGFADIEDLVVLDTSPDSLGELGRGISVQASGRASMRRVYLAGNSDTSVSLFGSELHLTDAYIHDTLGGPDGIGIGISAEDGALFVGERVVVRGSVDSAVVSVTESKVKLTDGFVLDTARAADVNEFTGVPILAFEGGEVELERVAVLRGFDLGLATYDGVIIARDTVVSGIQALEADPSARGAYVDRGRLVLERVHIVAVENLGIHVAVGAQAEFTDLLVADTRPAADSFGRGLDVGGGHATLERVTLRGNSQVGLVMALDASTIEATDVLIEGTLPQEPEGEFGRGMELLGGMLTARRVAMVGNRDMAIAVTGEATTVSFEDLLVTGTLPDKATGHVGRGLYLAEASEVTVSRAEFIDNYDVSVMAVDADSVLTARDLTIRETRSELASGRFGRGLSVQDGATVRLERVLLAANREVSLAIIGRDVLVTAHDLRVSETAVAECAANCPEAAGGTGVLVGFDSRLEARHFVLGDNELIGLQLAFGPTVALAEGRIVDNAIGLNSQETPDLDTDAWFDNVILSGNGTDVDVMEIPVPSAAEPLEVLR